MHGDVMSRAVVDQKQQGPKSDHSLDQVCSSCSTPKKDAMHSKSNLASTSRSTNTPSSLQRAAHSELEELTEKQWRLQCLPFALLSSHFPNKMNEFIVAAKLKSTSWAVPVPRTISQKRGTTSTSQGIVPLVVLHTKVLDAMHDDFMSTTQIRS